MRTFGYAKVRKKQTFIVRLCVCSFVVALGGGCVVAYLPANYHAAESRRNVDRGLMASIVPGRTTKVEVFLMLGEPDSSIEDGSQLVYRWTKVKGFWMVGVGNLASMGKDRKVYSLVITFDQSGVVLNRKLLVTEL